MMCYDCCSNYHTLRGAFVQAEAAYQAAHWTVSDGEVKHEAFTSIHAARLRFLQGADPTLTCKRPCAGRNIDVMPMPSARRTGCKARLRLLARMSQEPKPAWLTALELAQRSGIRCTIPCGSRSFARRSREDRRKPENSIEQALAEGAPHLEAAEVYLALGERELARQHILPAYKRAWADGPPYAYVYDLGRARAVLADLGMAEPTLPAYDPASVRPIPEEAAIRAFIAELEQKKVESAAG